MTPTTELASGCVYNYFEMAGALTNLQTALNELDRLLVWCDNKEALSKTTDSTAALFLGAENMSALAQGQNTIMLLHVVFKRAWAAFVEFITVTIFPTRPLDQRVCIALSAQKLTNIRISEFVENAPVNVQNSKLYIFHGTSTYNEMLQGVYDLERSISIFKKGDLSEVARRAMDPDNFFKKTPFEVVVTDEVIRIETNLGLGDVGTIVFANKCDISVQKFYSDTMKLSESCDYFYKHILCVCVDALYKLDTSNTVMASDPLYRSYIKDMIRYTEKGMRVLRDVCVLSMNSVFKKYTQARVGIEK